MNLKKIKDTVDNVSIDDSVQDDPVAELCNDDIEIEEDDDVVMGGVA